jgi:hypothetical protein
LQDGGNEPDKDSELDVHGQGGYRFDSSEHQQQLKEQRVRGALSGRAMELAGFLKS